MKTTRYVIGVDAREMVGGSGGKGRYVQELLPRLATQWPDASFRWYGGVTAPESLPSNAEWVALSHKGPLWHRHVAGLANRSCDFYFAPTSYLTALWLRIPLGLVVHDMIAWHHTLVPRAGSPRASWWHVEERLLFRRAGQKAAVLLADSQATATDVIKRFPVLESRLAVVPLAANPRFRADLPETALAAIRQRYHLPPAFILVTGTIEPRKNLARLFAAYAEIPAETRSHTPLVVVGRPGWNVEPIFEAMRAAQRTADIRYLDFVSDQDLPGLYSAATIFCYPSLYEGFGLPVLEAMASGVPVITSDRSSLPEVVGDAATLIDPTDTSAIQGALVELLHNPARRRSMAAAGLRQAKKFSWDRTAALSALAIFQSVKRLPAATR